MKRNNDLKSALAQNHRDNEIQHYFQYQLISREFEFLKETGVEVLGNAFCIKDHSEILVAVFLGIFIIISTNYSFAIPL